MSVDDTDEINSNKQRTYDNEGQEQNLKGNQYEHSSSEIKGYRKEVCQYDDSKLTLLLDDSFREINQNIDQKLNAFEEACQYDNRKLTLLLDDSLRGINQNIDQKLNAFEEACKYDDDKLTSQLDDSLRKINQEINHKLNAFEEACQYDDGKLISLLDNSFRKINQEINHKLNAFEEKQRKQMNASDENLKGIMSTLKQLECSLQG